MKPNDPLALTGSVVTLVSAAILAGYCRPGTPLESIR